MSQAAPRCPSCDLQGIEHIVSSEGRERARDRKPWFIVVHCNGCGHVYNVLAKHVFAQNTAPRLTLPDP
ncbi:MAG: transcriptional regulator [Pseudomonadota bacterium]